MQNIHLQQPLFDRFILFFVCSVQEIQEPVHGGEEGSLSGEAGGKWDLQGQKGSLPEQVPVIHRSRVLFDMVYERPAVR